MEKTLSGAESFQGRLTKTIPRTKQKVIKQPEGMTEVMISQPKETEQQ